MKDINKLTDKQLDILGHSLGVNVYHARLSKKKKDKILPKSYYRNNFCAGTERHSEFEFLKALEDMGLMERWMHTDQLYFFVTDSGIKVFEEQFKKDISGIKTKEEREQEEKELLESTTWEVAKELGETYGAIGRSENYNNAKKVIDIIVNKLYKK